MFASIAVGIEMGSLMDAVTEVALDLALVHGAALRAIYVEDTDLLRASFSAPFPALPPEGPIPMDPHASKELEEKFRQDEREIGRRFLRLVSDYRLRGSFRVERGSVPEALIEESRAHDLLVVGKRGSSAERKGEALGDHVEAITRHAFCPVLIVPPGGEMGDRILVAYDGSVVAHRALTTAVHLIKEHEALLRVLVVAEEEEGYDLLQKANSYLESHDVRAELERKEGDPAEVILADASRWEAGVLAMGAYGHGKVSQLFGRAATHRVLEDLDRLALLCGPQVAA